MATASERAKAKDAPESKPLDLSAEFQTAEQIAEGEWIDINLPSGARFPCKLARATGGHFAAVVLAVKRKFTRNGKKDESKLSGREVVDMSREIMAKANFLDIGGPVLIREEGRPERIIEPHCDWRDRSLLLEVYPDLQIEIANAVGAEGKDFAEMVSEVGEE